MGAGSRKTGVRSNFRLLTSVFLSNTLFELLGNFFNKHFESNKFWPENPDSYRDYPSGLARKYLKSQV